MSDETNRQRTGHVSQSARTETIDRRAALKRLVGGVAGAAVSTALTACGSGDSPSTDTLEPAVSGPSGSGGGAKTVPANTPPDAQIVAEPKLGSFERPYTQENPGDFSAGKELRQAVVQGVQRNASASKPIYGLWVEIMNPATLAPYIIKDQNSAEWLTKFDALASESLHPSTTGNYVSELRVVDAATNRMLAAASFDVGDAARFMFDHSLRSITDLKIYARIEGAGGWWMSVVKVDQSQLASATSGFGSIRRPLNRNQAGVFGVGARALANKVFGHSGNVKVRKPDGTGEQLAAIRVVFGEPNRLRKHGRWTVAHHFVGGYLLDQRGQLITAARYTWASGETGTTDGGKIPKLAPTQTTVVDGDPGTGTSATDNEADSAGVVYLDLILPADVTEVRLAWLCSFDGWWHIRGDVTMAADS